MIRLLHILAQLEEEVRPDIPDVISGNFYNIGLEKMREYLEDIEVDEDALDMLVDLVSKFYSQGKELDDAAELAAMTLTDQAAHWKDVAATPWFEEVQKMIRQVVGYMDWNGSGDFDHLPPGLTYLQKEQLIKNEEHLKTVVLQGLEYAEQIFLEDAVRAFLKEFQTDYVEPVRVQPELKMDDTPVDADFIKEPEDYSGRYAHAVV